MTTKFERKFTRSSLKSFCLVENNNQLIKGCFINYSQMGALIVVQKPILAKAHLSLIYQSDKSAFVKMASYTVHTYKHNGLFFIGVQFIALEARSAS